MFDDHLSNNSGAVPPNLPIGEPDDIFEAVASESPQVSVSVASPHIAVSEEYKIKQPTPAVRSAVDAGVLKPKQAPPAVVEPADMFGENPPSNSELPPISPSYTPSYSQPQNQSHNQYPPQDMRMTTPPPGMGGDQVQNQMYAVSEPIGKKRIVMWVIILVVLGILGLGSVWIYFSFIRNPDPLDEFGVSNNQVEQTPEQNETPIDINIPQDDADTEEEFNLENQILLGEPLDTDGDGLTDVREAELGTSPLLWDTDSDELGDYEEVTIWKTDPLNADTDEDGYGDNEEIENGYNPKGPGKLFQPPTTTEDVTTST